MWNQKITQQPLGDFSLGIYRLEIKELLGALAHDHTTHRRTHPWRCRYLGIQQLQAQIGARGSQSRAGFDQAGYLEQGQHSLRARMLLMIASTHLSGSALRLP